MAKDMPCGKESVITFPEPEAVAKTVTKHVMEGTIFGFVKCKISVPEHLWPKFEEMPPLFVNKEVPLEAVPEDMREYLKMTGRKFTNCKKLLGMLSADQFLLYTPLLKWYLEHGLELEAVYSIVTYHPEKNFTWFVEQVTEARRTGDTDTEKAIFAEVFKLLGNSGYGKLIEALERHTNTIYTKDEKTVDKLLRSAYFEDLTEIGEAYEIESHKVGITIKRPFQVGIAVYQLAKLRILEFYFDFLDRFVNRSDFELIQMDTDSLYFALSADKLDTVIKPELRTEFETCKNEWLAWDAWSNRTPGLFKLEFEGPRAIALCSKCYFVDGGKKFKHSTKGMSNKYNGITWRRFKEALAYSIAPETITAESIDKAENRGFRMRNGQMHTYHQDKLGLSAYYDKRHVLPDGIHTEPIEYKL
jgi:hypothetical protein